MYIIARMILGFGIPFCIINGSAMLGELGYPKERPTLTSLFNSSYYIGSVTAAAICLGTNYIPNDWAWRVPSFLQMAPSMIQCVGVFFLPESPRWLISKDRREEAFDILVKYHSEGDRDSVFVGTSRSISPVLPLTKYTLCRSRRRWPRSRLRSSSRWRTLGIHTWISSGPAE